VSKKLSDKVAVVTGASKGIGAAIARQLASEGAAVVVNYSSSKEGADRVVAEIKKDGGKAVAVQADVVRKPTSNVCSPNPRKLSVGSIFSSIMPAFTNSPRSRESRSRTFTNNTISMSSA